MSSSIPERRRDRLLGPFRKLVSGSPSADAALRPTPVQPTTTSLSAKDPFLKDALRLLTEREQSAVQAHVASDISTTVQAAYEAAEKQKNACKQKRWPGSDKADKVLLWLDRFKSVGDAVANVDPVHVGLPWAGIRVLLEAAVADSRQMSALISGMDLALCMANRLRAYFIYYQHLPLALTTDNLRTALVSLYAHVLRFFVQAIQVYSMNPALRKAQAFWQDSDLTTFESKCDKLGGRTDIEANACDRELLLQKWTVAAQWKTDLITALRNIDSIQQITRSLDILHIKADLSKLIVVWEATYNSSIEEKKSLCLSGTRSEILHNIQQWVDRPEGKFIFWLCGKAGTGKSTISRTVAQKFDKPQGSDEQRRLGASFFFKRGEQKRSNATLFFPTIAAQLADLIPQMRASISIALEEDSFLCGKGLQEQFEKLLLRPLSNLDLADLPRQRIVIVVDALDECDRSTDIPLFLRLLAQVEAASTIQLRIFLTSRPELPIKLGFQELDADGKRDVHQDIVLEEVQEETIGRDIRAYFDAEFAKIRKNRFDNTLLKDWPSEADLQTLVALAVPLFIFASTICRFVSEMKPQTRLKSILAQRYAAVPSHLAKTYLPILDNLLEDKERPEQNEIIHDFRKIVGPIILAAEPLSVASLAGLLRIQPQNISEEISDLLKNLNSVLDIPLSLNDPVRLLHLSFRDFLIDKKREDREAFWIDEAETHKKLAYCCLQRLREDGALQSDLCHVVRLGTKRSDLLIQQIRSQIPPDVVYACSYWPLHFIKSEERLVDNSPAHHFLQQHFLHWLEALSWLGRLSSAIAHISDLLSIVQNNSSAEVSRFLQDAKRFVLQNRHVIDLAPLQVYHSAMIFTPTQSIIRQIFHEQVPRLWAHLPKVPLGWSAETQKLEGHDDWVRAVAFSPDGQVIASASFDRTVRLWDAATGEQRQKLEGHDGAVRAVAFSPDGQVIASASFDRTVRLWDVATGEQRQKLEGHDSWVNAVAFSPDGQVIASASDDRTVRLWDAATGEQRQKLEGHDGAVNAVAFSPDGQVIASASFDRTVRLWDVATGEMIQLIPDVHPVSTITFSADGRSLQTDAGVFLLESSISGLPADTSARTTSLELRDNWVRNQDEALLWLPHEYRGSCSAIHEQTLVIGQISGAVSIFSLR